MRLLAIDGNSIMNRAYYGIKGLSSKKGVPTNAILGFMNIYLKALEDLKPDCIAVAFDLPAPTFRHKAVKSYKANRKGMPDDLAEQMPLIKELLAHLGIRIVEMEGYEADDILGTLSYSFCSAGHECIILTGDRDSLQLINDCVKVRFATTKDNILYDEARFVEEYGFKPNLLIDLKAFMGDSSDNIKGVAGIGKVTATKLVAEWGTIENIYDNLDKLNVSKSVIAKLEAGYDDAKESKWLSTIKLNVPIETDIEAYKPQPANADCVKRLLTELEMFKLLDRLNLDATEATLSIAQMEKPEITVVEMDEEKLIEILKLSEPVYYLYENECLKVILDDIVYLKNDKTYALDFLQSYVKKITFGAKPSYRLCFENNTELKNICFDAEIAGYLLNALSADYSIKQLCDEYSVEYYPDLGENADIVSLKKLCDTLEAEIKNTGMENLLNDIELPLTEVLASMEYYGVKVDTDGVRAFGDMLTNDLKSIQLQIYEYAGREFNISSPKQLGEVLFKELGLPARKKTKSGYSTNAEVLEDLKPYHPIVELILQYRQLFKLNTTYVEGLLKTVGDDSRIHTNFKQTETRTGRISSTEPNMQNIPVRTELGRNMRKFFVADEGTELIDADYSQIELRILAHLCDDEHMKEAFSKGMDIHTSTAAKVFKMPLELVTDSMRTYAKAVNFGIIYGIGAFSLSKDIGVSVAEADKYIKDYLNHYKNVERFMNDTVEQAKKNGYVTTLFGRRRYVPELSSSNKIMQAAGKRIAMNTPIQGTAADIIKIAMVKVYRRLKEENLNARLILQVHDELIVEGDKACAERVGEILREEMMNACELSVPLIAEVNVGKSWYDAKG